MSGLTYKLLKVYGRIVNKEIVVPQSTVKEAYLQVNEQPEGRFGTDVVYSSYTPWTPFQKSLYNEKFGDSNTGPGEGSIAAMLLQNSRPDISEEMVAQTYMHVIESMVRHKGSTTVDVYDVFTKQYYEVKQAMLQKSVMTGKESRGLATQIYNRIKNDFFQLYNIYVKLTPAQKSIIEKHKPNFKKTLEDIFIAGNVYFNATPGELARGSLMRLKTETATPKFFLLPYFFNEELLSDPEIKNIVPDAVDFIKDLYNVNELDARIIDRNIRDYIEKKKKQEGEKTSEDPNAALSDFLLISQTTVFASPAKFETEIQSYFLNNTPQANEALKLTFPNTGVFLVDPEKGYLYAGKEKLSTLLRVDNISKGGFKVVPFNAPEVPV